MVDTNILIDLGHGQLLGELFNLGVELVARVRHRYLSLADCSALVLAREGSLTLLTGDRRLRRLAQAEEVAVHGLLWLLDEMEAGKQIAGPRLAQALRRMMAAGARLPEEDCNQRLERWEQNRNGPAR